MFTSIMIMNTLTLSYNGITDTLSFHSGDDDSSYTPPGGRGYTKHRDIFLDSSTCSSCTSREEE
jgi:hypothetical protein